MSKNIVIQEGGVGKQLTVDKLKTDVVGGGTCLWVPEDERQLGTKYISENGTYRASADGYYGYSEVTVSGMGTATGKDPDGSGDDAVAYTDPSTGEIVVDKIPSSIKVVTPPSKVSYVDGEAISIAGIQVEAYLASGGKYGDVPFGELSFSPAIATYDESGDKGTQGKASYDAVTGLQQPISYCTKLTSKTQQGGGAVDIYTENAGAMAGYRSGGNYTRIMASASQPVSTWKTEWYNKDGEKYYEDTGSDNGAAFTYEGKTVYWYPAIGGRGALVPQNAVRSGGSPGEMDAWVMIYGNREETAGSAQTITVSWPCPKTGEMLSTTFEIFVTKSLGGATGGGGEAGDTGAGRND